MPLSLVGQKVELRSEVEIAASAELVWDVLCDLRAYQEWNPFIVEASGQLGPGGIVETTINLPGGQERRIRRRVVKFEPNVELRWSSASIMRALTSSEQFFRLRCPESSHIRLTVGENFTGMLAPHSNAELAQYSQALALMNQALKRRVEGILQQRS